MVLLEPVDESIKPVFLATCNTQKSRKRRELHTHPGEIGTAREIIGQCGDTAQQALQLTLERLEQTTCPYLADVL